MICYLETSSLIKSTVPSLSKGEANSAESAVERDSGGDSANDGHDGEDWQPQNRYQFKVTTFGLHTLASSTDESEIQEVNPPKTVAPPSTASTAK